MAISEDIGGPPENLTKAQADVWRDFRRSKPEGTELCYLPMVDQVVVLGAMDREHGLNPGQLKLMRKVLVGFGLSWVNKQFWPRKKIRRRVHDEVGDVYRQHHHPVQ
jgi:hypothetical protein